MFTKMAFFIAMCLLLYSAPQAMNGRAVSVAFYNGSSWVSSAVQKAPELVTGGQDYYWRGSLCMYTIENNRVARCDTLCKRSQGLAQYPGFSLDGQKVAFYHWGARVSGSTLVGATSSDSIAVVNIDGTGLINLCKLDCHPNRTNALCWPAGDWIYYVMPKYKTGCTDVWNDGQQEIWKVNSITKENQKVCSINLGWPQPPQAHITRFTLSANANRMGLQYEAQGNNPDGTYDNVNGLYCFPPPDGNIKTTGCPALFCGSCNSSISPSGCFIGTYGGGWHEQAILCSDGNGGRPKGDIPGADRPTISQLQSWTGVSFLGIGAEIIRWSANSDKWFNQRIFGWEKNPRIDNSVGANFVDHQAVLCQMSVNASLSPANYDAGQVVIGNCTGQIWVNDPVNNPLGNKYEDVNGQWHVVNGTAIEPVVTNRSAPAFSLHSDARGIAISTPDPATIELLDARGRCVLRRMVAGHTLINESELAPGLYMVRLSRNGSLHSVCIVRSGI